MPQEMGLLPCWLFFAFHGLWLNTQTKSYAVTWVIVVPADFEVQIPRLTCTQMLLLHLSVLANKLMEDHWSFLPELPQKENMIYCWNLSNYLQISQFRKIFCQQLCSRKCHDFFVLLPSFFCSLSYLLSISFIIFASGYLDTFRQIFLTQPVVCCGILSAFTSFFPPLFKFVQKQSSHLILLFCI